jgi:GTPase involved in cell partitioning and DNA repair
MEGQGHTSNDVSLREFVEQALADYKEFVSQRFIALEASFAKDVKRLEDELDTYEKHALERWAADRLAVSKAEIASATALQAAKTESDERLKQHNGVLEYLKDAMEKFKLEVLSQLQSFARKENLERVEKAVNEHHTAQLNSAKGVSNVFAVEMKIVLAIGAIVGIIVAIADHFFTK